MSVNRRRMLIVLGGAVALFGVVWLVVAVLVPLREKADCAGVEFGADVDLEAPTAREAQPPLGGTGGLAGRLRSALRGDTPAVYCDDFADPFVLRVGGTYYAYSTNTEEFRVPVLTSDGLFGTARRSEALANLPDWATPGKVWAPSVLERPEGFVLYYSTPDGDPSRECLSRAFATEPSGPFVDGSEGPLVCPPDGGAIDPSPVVDPDGRTYLLWKNYGSVDGIVVQELSDDGLELVGEMGLLVEADQPWEGGLVEAPSMVGHEGRYYLFYSAHEWSSEHYAIGYAVCDSPMGPCAKPAEGPWLSSTERAHGPGGQEVFTDERGNLWMVLHAWLGGRVGYPEGARNLFVVPLDFVEGVPFTGT